MKRTLIAISLLIAMLYACKEEDTINTPELSSTQASQDNLTAENIFNDIGRIVEEGLTNSGQKKSCPHYSLMNTDTLDLDTLIINFGDGECPPIYGKIRTGKIVVTYNGKYRDSLSTITTTFNNYYVNHYLVQGEKILTNKGRNNDGNLWFTIDINMARISSNNSGTINWEADRVKEWVEGENTYFDISDDRYIITGNAQGNAANGNDFTVKITEPLQVDLGCLPSCIIKSGIAEVSPKGYADRIINYGDSLCDCNTDILSNGNTYHIVIVN